MLYGMCGVAETRFTTLSFIVLAREKNPARRNYSVTVAELSNQQNDPMLYDIITKNMVHGPCGEHNLTALCMRNAICTKKYPRRFVNDTQTGEDGYPVYRRRDAENGRQIATLNIRGNEFNIDNRWIVLYSPLLCRTFHAHMNVECCHSV